MAQLKPFKGLRPQPDKVKAIASRPYDVLDSDEARQEAAGNPYSFLHVIKPEIDLPPQTDHYAPEVYQTGRDNFQQMIKDEVFFQDEKESIYLYQLTMGNHSQTGIVGCAAVQDYLDDVIKKHELTRPDKEEDRKNHVRITEMNAEPVFFAYPAQTELDQLVQKWASQHPPLYDFVAEDQIAHRFWQVDDAITIRRIMDLFQQIPHTYVADGHHRTAAAALVGQEMKKENPGHQGDEPYNYFLAVHFPHNQLQIIDYNRVVTDLNGLSPDQFLEKLNENFKVEKQGTEPYKPDALHKFGLYMDQQWYALTAKEGTYQAGDPIGVLDVTILSEKILAPILNIHDLRRDKRIDFVGGIRGLEELEKRVDQGNMRLAFALYPVSMEQLMNIADSGKIMPPKTTWFEPKLRSGLVVHRLKD
ncbi:MAG: DUF1015 domain-containing protein [Candidatus Cyclobacteriaceae bacterium M3_2C_046]